MTTALVLDFGGTCPNRGCTPKKILVAAAQSLETIANASVHGIEVGPATLDWPKLISREQQMVSSIPASMEGLARKRGDVFRGTARFTGPNSVDIKKISGAGERLSVDYEHDDGAAHSIGADRIVNGAGRIANVEGLDLDAGGVSHDGARIEVDEYLCSTSNPAVWVVGDALWNSPQLSPVATAEGRVVGENIVNGARMTTDWSALPSSVYTIPAYSSVGLTEEQAREQYGNLRVSSNDMTGWFSGKSYGETVAWAKVLVDDDSDRIVGAHIIGHHGEDLINLFVLAMRHSIAASQLKDTIFAYPTFSADVKNLF